MKIKPFLLICIILCFLTGCETAVQVPELLDVLTVEAGTSFLDPGAFLVNPEDAAPTVLEGLSAEQLSTPGTYPVTLACSGNTYNVSVCVVDTTAPVGVVRALTCTDDIPDASAFLAELRDATFVTVGYEAEPVRQNGTQTVTLILTDTSGNTTKLEAALTLDLDLEAPQILGVKDILVDQGKTVAYRNDITVTDNRDPAPALSVDSSQVNLSEPGTYTVIYRATDAAGNMAEMAATVTVREMKDDYASLETIYAEVDKLLDRILEEGMTLREQLLAINKWFLYNCTYTGSSDKADLHQAAYYMMTRYKGDCYNYHALTKLMLDRLGVPNIDVYKVKNYEYDSNHYWSMVSLDGGETWYHYDCSPRVDPDTDEVIMIFLYTDAELDAFSARYRNCYNRDKSLYPATPES